MKVSVAIYVWGFVPTETEIQMQLSITELDSV